MNIGNAYFIPTYVCTNTIEHQILDYWIVCDILKTNDGDKKAFHLSFHSFKEINLNENEL